MDMINDSKQKKDYNERTYERIFEKISGRKLIGSPYLRFIELLHLFSIDFKELFSEYNKKFYQNCSDSETLSSTRSRFTDDATRYKNNSGFLEYYFVAFQKCLSEREGASYNVTISPVLYELETTIEKSDSSLITDYNKYKEFFSLFFNKVNTVIKMVDISDTPAAYIATLLRLKKNGISLFFGFELVRDMINDYHHLKSPNESANSELWLTYIAKLCDPQNCPHPSTHVFLNLFSSFKRNWDFIQKLSHNKELHNYLFNILLSNKNSEIEFINSKFDSLNRMPPIGIIKREMKYAYLLNYSPVTRPSSKEAVLAFYRKKLKDDYLTVVFCCANIAKLSCLSTEVLNNLYIYACLIDS